MTEESKTSEKRFQMLEKTFLGYYLPTNPFVISLIAIFAALTCVMTMTIEIPVLATGGYINIGDFIVMFTGLMFGPIIGGLAGGIGSCLADIFLGWPLYALPTLIIKGLEGFVVGIIANPKNEPPNGINASVTIIKNEPILRRVFLFIALLILPINPPCTIAEVNPIIPNIYPFCKSVKP